MTETRMPRGMLRGCQRRANYLESLSTAKLVVVAIYFALRSVLAAGFMTAIKLFRQKEWWEFSTEEVEIRNGA